MPLQQWVQNNSRRVWGVKLGGRYLAFFEEKEVAEWWRGVFERLNNVTAEIVKVEVVEKGGRSSE